MGKLDGQGQILAELLLTFMKIGFFTFGGGYAMLPMLQRELVEKNGWCTETDLLDYFAVGQCTPGIIAVNTATFVGYKTRGNLGGIIATLGMVFPSLVIITLIFSVLNAFQENIYVKRMLSGIQIAVCGLITVSVMKLFRKSIVDIPTLAICLAAFALMLIGVSPIILVCLGIIIGEVLSLIKARRAIG